jgi:hypothetical protein
MPLFLVLQYLDKFTCYISTEYEMTVLIYPAHHLLPCSMVQCAEPLTNAYRAKLAPFTHTGMCNQLAWSFSHPLAIMWKGAHAVISCISDWLKTEITPYFRILAMINAYIYSAWRPVDGHLAVSNTCTGSLQTYLLQFPN